MFTICGTGYLVQKVGEELPRLPFYYCAQSFVIHPTPAGYVVYYWPESRWERYNDRVYEDQHKAFNHVYDEESARWAKIERGYREK